MSELRKMYARYWVVREGYDCITKPCGKNGCGERSGSNHGVRAEKWFYGLIDHEAGLALSLDVTTTKYPETVSRAHRFRDVATGGMVCLHAAFPVEEDDIREGRAPDDCDMLGKCYRAGCGGLIADEIVKKHFVESRGIDGQHEEFWETLTEIFDRWSRSEDVVKARTSARCQCCSGRGIVTTEQETVKGEAP